MGKDRQTDVVDVFTFRFVSLDSILWLGLRHINLWYYRWPVYHAAAAEEDDDDLESEGVRRGSSRSCEKKLLCREPVGFRSLRSDLKKIKFLCANVFPRSNGVNCYSLEPTLSTLREAYNHTYGIAPRPRPPPTRVCRVSRLFIYN